MSKKEYIKKIVAILIKANDTWVIKQIYRCAVNMTSEEKDGEKI